MMNDTRKEGYYWVRYKTPVIINGVWIVAFYSTTLSRWLCHGQETEYVDTSFTEINETRIPSPDEAIDFSDDIYIPDNYEESYKKRVRSIADHNELHEYKHEDTGKMFDVDFEILDRL